MLLRLAAAVLCAHLTLNAAPGYAAQSFSLSARAPQANGRALAYGEVVYWQNKTTFVVKSTIVDECGPNGAGDGIETRHTFIVSLADLSTNNTNTWTTSGCGPGQCIETTVSRNQNIRGVYAQVYQGYPGQAPLAGQGSACIDNPHVAGGC
jgi:hypothetical protein